MFLLLYCCVWKFSHLKMVYLYTSVIGLLVLLEILDIAWEVCCCPLSLRDAKILSVLCHYFVVCIVDFASPCKDSWPISSI